MLTYDLKTRARMYLWVTLLCGATAAMMQLLFAGNGEVRNYAERQLDEAVRASIHGERLSPVNCHDFPHPTGDIHM